ncbi:tetratricopeptide repeat-containing protein [Besnoitia besnoiti]|uniref:Tetratricopeptide repeat-containing protein n=1 Tax=Besnoitia besnoiti TaxID=94643 RepID=A0A2A9MP40_BESBE|nr:tetratricopeptide repeat-containing protein [Besnoitia besnoiti]PFH37757.1 tetratricopeptide repeat-containing protein [Besnoitia besnoiti]
MKKKRQNKRGDRASLKARSAVAAEVLQSSADAASASSENASSLPPSFFLQKAEKCLESFPPEFALSLKFLRKGVSVHPNDVSLLVRTAEMLTEEGRLDEAKQLLQKAIKIEPEKKPEKYFYLAQIEEGRTSLQLFRRASALLEASLSDLDVSVAQAEQRQRASGDAGQGAAAAATRLLKEERRCVARQLVEAKCSVSELFMTDLCDEEEAEGACKTEIEETLRISEKYDGAGLPDALYLHASFLKTTGDIEGARSTSLRAAALIHEQLKQRDENLRITASTCEGDEDVSSRELRVNLARVLIDVQEPDAAVLLVSSCIEEDDQDADSWLILSCGLFKANKFGAARESLEHLQQLLTASGVAAERDNPLCVHTNELLRIVKEEQAKEAATNGGGENDDEDDWEEEDDAEDVDMGDS